MRMPPPPPVGGPAPTAHPDRAPVLRAAGPLPENTTPFFNRDLSWLEFNRRVLHEAADERTPLLERVKFLAIYSSNSDEFFMKRIGLLKRKIDKKSANAHTTA
jgi:polyphosphate kinase